MKKVYPVVISPAKEGGYVVHIPDFDCDTQGETMAEAIEMARDAIGLVGIDLEDEGKPIPEPSEVSSIRPGPGETVALVDIDFSEYRRAHDNRAVRKNVTIPSWLNKLAEDRNLNFSAVLQEALKERLNIQDRP